MSALVGFFLGGPARIQGLLALAGIALLAGLGLLTAMLYYRGEYREVVGKLALMQAQAQVLAEATAACSAGVTLAKSAGDRAVKDSERLLAEARRVHQGVPAVVKDLRALMNKPPTRADGAAKDCRDAWSEIERVEKAGR